MTAAFQGHLERKALQRLLEDVEVAWLTSLSSTKLIASALLADFAKLVDIFDRHSVTFVSVTQSFNTQTSMDGSR